MLLSVGELCNGSTYDSDSYCLGSNPSSPAKTKPPEMVVFVMCQGFESLFERLYISTKHPKKDVVTKVGKED